MQEVGQPIKEVQTISGIPLSTSIYRLYRRSSITLWEVLLVRISRCMNLYSEFMEVKPDMKKISNCGKRKGIKDIWWNAFFVKTCVKWALGDIPECPTELIEIPEDLLTWPEAVKLYNKLIKKNKNFRHNAYVCFFCDDYLFDGPRGIWNDYHKAIEILKHFAGMISPDFSTYKDFPTPLKVWNTYRMRAFGYWCTTQGINVINNVRWSSDTMDICFKGIPKNSIVCLGVIASDIRKAINWPEYEYYLKLMVQELQPKIILVYGSARYKFFKELQNQGIVVKSYQTSRNRKKAAAGDCHE